MDQHLKELLTSLKKIINIIILRKKSMRNLEKTENIMDHVRHAEKKIKIYLEKRKLENQIDSNVLKKLNPKNLMILIIKTMKKT